MQRRENCYWRVVANIDSEYDSIQECLDDFRTGASWKPFLPFIPATRAPMEDDVTPRLPVCARLEDCFTAIGLLGRFRRCLAANDGAFSYMETYDEAYPVLACKFDGNLPSHQPSVSEVHDVEMTHEVWLLQRARPVDVQLMWLDSYSLLWDEENERVCKSVRFVSQEDLGNKVHPWLTGTGNILESSLMDYEWKESPYRSDWAPDEAKWVREAFFVDRLTVPDLRCMLVPYRSSKEILEVLRQTPSSDDGLPPWQGGKANDLDPTNPEGIQNCLRGALRPIGQGREPLHHPPLHPGCADAQ